MQMIFGGNPGTAKTTVARLFVEVMKDEKVLFTGKFVDGVYSLCDSYKHGFGDEAINMLVQEMENHRDDVIVIVAGYPKPMNEFFDRNPGVLSRTAFRIEFEDYTLEELCEITTLMFRQKQMSITKGAMEKLKVNYEMAMKNDDYGNGCFVRKMLEESEMNLAEHILNKDDIEFSDKLITTIEESDIKAYTLAEKKEKISIGFAC